MGLQTGGVGQAGMGILTTAGPAQPGELLVPGAVLTARVLSTAANRAVLLLRDGHLLEVSLRTSLQSGERIRVQVQQPESEPTEGAGRTIFLKLLGAGETDVAEGGAAARFGQTSSNGTAAAAQAIVWLPVPLAGDRQGWAQLAVQRERKGSSAGVVPAERDEVRLWWETPALGAVGVTFSGTGETLAVRFQVQETDTLRRLTAALPALQTDLEAAGFSRPSLSCRRLRTGDEQGPVRAGAHTLDRRL